MTNNIRITSIHNNNNTNTTKRRMTLTILITICILGVVLYKGDLMDSIMKRNNNLSLSNGFWTVYQEQQPMNEVNESKVNRIRIMIENTNNDESRPRMKYKIVEKGEQDRYIRIYGDRCHGEKNVVWEAYKKSSTLQYKLELWKYCVLYNEGGVMLGNEIVLLKELHSVLYDPRKNYAVANLENKSVHSSSLIRLHQHSLVAFHMVHSLIEQQHEKEDLDKLLYNFILTDVTTEMSTETLQSGSNGHNWYLFELKCPFSSNLNEEKQCTLLNGYCCHVSSHSNDIQLLVRNPGLDIQRPQPISSKDHYITQISYKTYSRPANVDTPNMFHILMQNDCLPTDRHCHKCLRSSSASKGSCTSCLHVCHCYCQVLCQILPEPKFISAKYTLQLPMYTPRSFHYSHSSNPSLDKVQGLIPPIVHQTWFEPVSKEKYPNMSRLIRSFQLSGLQYKFYDDQAAQEFLAAHFPPEVKEAYDALLPGAFKADLFRYCVLLIEGGIYADMDVLLQTNLHTLLTQQKNHDIAFLIPIDEPGAKVGHRMCLWNGFIASKPGHPILAKVIEIVVNNIRNRFTGVDYDTMFCPTPMLSVSHTVDMLLTTGPCILGYAINTLLEKHPQSSFSPGEITSPLFPGRTIILDQNKNDMGAHRFTFLDQNIIVAATDMPEYEDRPNQKTNHYSKTRVQAGVYGLDSLYSNDHNVDEEIRLEFASS